MKQSKNASVRLCGVRHLTVRALKQKFTLVPTWKKAVAAPVAALITTLEQVGSPVVYQQDNVICSKCANRNAWPQSQALLYVACGEVANCLGRGARWVPVQWL